MKLLTSDTSPYGRKVRIAIVEKGLEGEVALVAQGPFDADVGALRAANPLGKIPALVLDDGQSLYDSRVICEYLDEVGQGPRLLPPGPARFDTLRRQALADGVMDAAFNLVMERRRPDVQRAPEWMARWDANIVRGVAAMEARATFDLGAIATAAALGYLEFRLPEIAWREQAPAMAAWWDGVRGRASVRGTAP